MEKTFEAASRPQNVTIAIALLIADAGISTYWGFQQINSFNVINVILETPSRGYYFFEIVALWLFYFPVIYLLSRGQSWARWLVVFALVGSIVTAQSPGYLDYIQLAMDGYATYLLFTEPAAAWFREQTVSVEQLAQSILTTGQRGQATTSENFPETTIKTPWAEIPSIQYPAGYPFYRKLSFQFLLMVVAVAITPIAAAVMILLMWTGPAYAYSWQTKKFEHATRNQKILLTTALILIWVLRVVVKMR